MIRISILYGLLLIFLISCTQNRSKETNYSIHLDDVTLECNSDQIIDGDTLPYYPYQLFATFTVTNKDSKQLLFGSNNNRYAKGDDHKSYGMFYLVYQTDTLKFLTRKRSISRVSKNKSVQFVAEYDNYQFFEKLPKENFQEYLHQMFTQGQIFYAPVVNDYGNTSENNRYFPMEKKQIEDTDSLLITFNVDGQTVGFYPNQTLNN